MRQVDTILFDFDGTIMNTNDLIIATWQHTFVTVEGKERPEADIIRTFGEPLFTTMAKVLPQISPDAGVDIYRRFMLDHYHEMIHPFPGMVELMSDLKAEGYRTAVVTSRLPGTTYKWLDQFDLRRLLDSVVTCDDTDKHKPDPEPVLIALDRLSAEPEQALMIGDSMFDILCARNAGVRSVLVGWHLAVPEEEITGPNAPDFLVEEPGEIKAILAGLNND